MTLRQKIEGLNPNCPQDAMKIARIMCAHNYLKAKEEYAVACSEHIKGYLTDDEFMRLADIYTGHMAKMVYMLEQTK